MRLFTAIELPDETKLRLARMAVGIPRARWVPEAQLHLTLRFIGETDGLLCDDIVESLAGVEMAPFDLKLKGVGCFPPRRVPRVLWVGVEDADPPAVLKRRIDRALADVGIAPEGRKFSAHVTLARVAKSPLGRVMRFLVEHSDFELSAGTVSGFTLFSSLLSPKGAQHRVEAEYRFDQFDRSDE
jgi:2'-5' RNA ligase